MLVLHVDPYGEWEEVYFGPFAAVKEASRRSNRDNKDMIAVSKLRTLMGILKTQGAAATMAAASEMPQENTPAGGIVDEQI